METLKVLVVDDELGIRLGIERVLKNYIVSFPFHDDDFNYEVINAESGEDAVKILDNQTIDVVLLDNKLPGIEGIEVLEYIKNQGYDCVVMMITSYASIDLAIKATNNGAYNFLPKPFTQQDIKTAIESITKHLFLKRMTSKMNEEGKKIRFKFLSVLAHELKSPINAVEGYLQIIKDRQLGDNLNAYNQMFDRSLERIRGMRALIMDMLDLTRIESGTRARAIAKHDIIQIARICIDGILPLAKQKKVKIVTNFPEQLIAQVDQTEIEIIFNNLLSNAVKYNKDGGQVDFSITSEGQQAVFVVKDTGIGMSEQEQSHLFEEFMRAKNEKTSKIAGTGLGLSIMKKIIELNHGTINVDSKIDFGTTFTVKLLVVS